MEAERRFIMTLPSERWEIREHSSGDTYAVKKHPDEGLVRVYKVVRDALEHEYHGLTPEAFRENLKAGLMALKPDGTNFYLAELVPDNRVKQIVKGFKRK